MKNIRIIYCLILVTGLSLGSCDEYVNDVDPLVDQIDGTNLPTQENIDLLITGLLNRAGGSGDTGTGFGRMLWRAAGYSDEMLHAGIRGGAPDHGSFVQDSPGDLRFYEDDWEINHAIHYLADDLVNQVAALDAAEGFSDGNVKSRALFYGNLFGGLSRMYLADHWGARATTGDTPGATFTTPDQVANNENGAFFTSAELHAMAREKFMSAAANDPGDVANHDKVAWSFIARTYLFDGMYAEAKTAAENGLQQGDEAFGTEHSLLAPNQMWLQSGRTNDTNVFLFSPHPRFIQYVLDDRKEGEIISSLTQDDIDEGIISYSLRGIESGEGEPGNRGTENPRAGLANQNERLPLWEERIIVEDVSAIGESSQWAAFESGATATQDYYRSRDSKLDLIDWREMELILAEVAINANDNATALIHINNVRSFHGLDDYSLIDMTGYDNPNGGASSTGIDLKGGLTAINITGPLGLLIEERDKTLWMKGTRLPDQKRFALWHLEGGSVLKFYMPIPRSETNVNPNVPN